MPDWEVATALGIALLVALTTHVFYRRPPAALWPALPLVFGSALVFSLGDLIANLWAQDPSIRWVGMVMVYTGLLTIAPGWWLFTRNFSQMYGYEKVAFQSSLKVLVSINVLLWIGLVTNPWHGQFLEAHPAARSTYGPLWYATAGVNYYAMLAAMAVHARASLHMADTVIRAQCRILVAAVAIPMAMNMVYVFSPTPLSYDPTALGFALSCSLFLFAVERRDLFVLERVSLPSVLDADADAILIVTGHYRLLFANPAAHALFGPGQLVPGSAGEELLARPLEQLGQAHVLGVEAHGRVEGPQRGTERGQEFRVGIPVRKVHYPLWQRRACARAHRRALGDAGPTPAARGHEPPFPQRPVGGRNRGGTHLEICREPPDRGQAAPELKSGLPHAAFDTGRDLDGRGSRDIIMFRVRHIYVL